jgi:glycosyltransferase involved in cell wall biosynthesis
MMRICLIGPSHPFRGGISHHTTLLYHHLRKKHQVSFYAFKRQYPKWLFPGRTDRDASQRPLRDDEVQYILDSVNPITWWAIYRKIKREAPDLVIIPWWNSFWTVQFWTIATLLKRFGSAKILFICHNVVDHEHYVFSKRCARAVLTKGDHFLVHSENDARHLKELLPWAKATKVFHPVYDFFHSAELSKIEAKKTLGLTGEILLFFGFIRPYKGLDDLLEAMPLILAHRRVTLLVVGEFWEGRERYLKRIEELRIGSGVKIVEGYVPNEQVQLYFTAADLVLLPYVSGTGSGILQIAYACNKPVIATRVGCFPDVIDDGKTGYLVSSRAPWALSAAVVRFFIELKEKEFVNNINLKKEQFTWDRLVSRIELLVEKDRRNFDIKDEKIEGALKC